MDKTLTDHRSPPVLVWVYRIVLMFIGYSTIKGISIAVTRPADFMDSFPGASDVVYYFFLTAAAVGFVSLIGLFHFQRWGAVVFTILAVGVTIVDVIVQAPVAHTLAGVFLSIVVLGLAYLHRARFT